MICASVLSSALALRVEPEDAAFFQVVLALFAALLLSFWMNVPKLSFGLGLLYLAVLVLLFAVRMKRIGDGAAALTYRLLDELPKDLSELFDWKRFPKKPPLSRIPKSASRCF